MDLAHRFIVVLYIASLGSSPWTSVAGKGFRPGQALSTAASHSGIPVNSNTDAQPQKPPVFITVRTIFL